MCCVIISCLPLTSLHLARTSHHKIWHSEHFLSTSDIFSLRIALHIMLNVTIFFAYNALSGFGSYIYVVGICRFFVVVGRCFSRVSHICFPSFHQLVLNSELTNPLLCDIGFSNRIGCKTHKNLVLRRSHCIPEARNIGPDKPQFTASYPIIKPIPSTRSKKKGILCNKLLFNNSV